MVEQNRIHPHTGEPVYVPLQFLSFLQHLQTFRGVLVSRRPESVRNMLVRLDLMLEEAEHAAASQWEATDDQHRRAAAFIARGREILAPFHEALRGTDATASDMEQLAAIDLSAAEAEIIARLTTFNTPTLSEQERHDLPDVPFRFAVPYSQTFMRDALLQPTDPAAPRIALVSLTVTGELADNATRHTVHIGYAPSGEPLGEIDLYAPPESDPRLLAIAALEHWRLQRANHAEPPGSIDPLTLTEDQAELAREERAWWTRRPDGPYVTTCHDKTIRSDDVIVNGVLSTQWPVRVRLQMTSELWHTITQVTTIVYRELGVEVAPAPPVITRSSGRPRGEVPIPLPPVLKFSADRINMGVVRGYARALEWVPTDDFARALTVAENPRFRQVIGLRIDPNEALWSFLRTSGERAIKGHYALWARCYEQTGGDPGEYVTLSIPQFCADLGYTRHHKGGFRLRDKQDAKQLLEVLTATELAVEYVPPGKNAKVQRLLGPVWSRGLEAAERDQYSAPLGATCADDRALWEPVAFSYRPGPWFADPEWRRYNKYVGLIGAGLLKLDTRNDRWAIRIGGYYGTLARISGYQERRIAVLTVLRQTGLDTVNTGHPAEQREAFARAHNRLRDVGVLKDWRWDTEPVAEPDMDDPEALAHLADYESDDWRRQCVILTWPEVITERAPALRDGQRRTITQVASRQRLPSPLAEPVDLPPTTRANPPHDTR